MTPSLAPVARAKGLDLRIIDSALIVESDPGYLRRIIQNLLSNAIRYTETGKVVVGIRRQNGRARIEVHDTGPGIATGDQKTIFQEFKRLNRDSNATGHGLGLAIVERACSNLDHPLTLRSAPGKGSCFSLNVPIIPHAPTRLSIADRRAPIQQNIELSQIVLLVENDRQLAQAMTIMIEGWGGDVIFAKNAADALALLADIQLTPDVMLLDYQLGQGLSGTQLYQAIVQQNGPVPTAIVSADRSRQLGQICQDLGIELMSKPIDKSRLLHFLQNTDQNATRPDQWSWR